MSLTFKRLSVAFLGLFFVFFVGRWSTSVDLFSEKSVSNKQLPNQLEKIQEKKSLDVVMVNGPTTYFVGAIGKEGFEYLLMKKFAEHLDVNLTLHVVSTVNEAIRLTKEGVGDIRLRATLQRLRRRDSRFEGTA